MSDNIEISVKYDPDNIDHVMTLKRYLKSTKMAIALWDIHQLYRNYKHANLTSDQWKIVDEYTEKINAILEEHGIDLDELIN